jgi:hypothetical protein
MNEVARGQHQQIAAAAAAATTTTTTTILFTQSNSNNELKRIEKKHGPNQKMDPYTTLAKQKLGLRK